MDPTRPPNWTVSQIATTVPQIAVRLESHRLLQYHICPPILVGTPSATALLQHGIPLLPPSKIVRPYIYSFKRHLKVS